MAVSHSSDKEIRTDHEEGKASSINDIENTGLHRVQKHGVYPVPHSVHVMPTLRIDTAKWLNYFSLT